MKMAKRALRQALRAGAVIVSAVMMSGAAYAQAPMTRDMTIMNAGEAPVYDSAAMFARAEGREAYRFESENFIMSGQIEKEDGRALLADLESFRAAVLLAIGEDYAPEIRKIEVFYAADNTDFEFITARPGAGGIYRRTFEAPVFVINGGLNFAGKAGQRQIAYHELTHHLLGTYYKGLLPMWLGEGLSEYFSAFERADDGTVTFGHVMPENVKMLSEFDWMAPRTLLESIQDYPFRSMSRSGNGFSYVDFFYAQSWLTTHYFQSDPARLDKLSDFVAGLDPAIDSEEVFTKTFGGTYESFEQDLKTYLAAGRFDTQTLVSPKGPDDFAMTITSLSAGGLLLAQAEAARKMIDPGEDHEPLQALYEALTAQQGETADLLLARARVLSSQDMFTDAIAPLERALAASPQNAKVKSAAGVIYMGRNMSLPEPDMSEVNKARKLLRGAFADDPDNIEAHYYYALSYVLTGETAPRDALASAYKAKTYVRGQGFGTQRLFLAPVFMQHEKFAEAKPLIENVLRWNDSYEIKRTARRMQRMLERLESGY